MMFLSATTDNILFLSKSAPFASCSLDQLLVPTLEFWDSSFFLHPLLSIPNFAVPALDSWTIATAS